MAEASNSGGITVRNESGEPIWVSVAKWGDTGNTSYFRIDSSKYESWDRSDPRGFILTLRRNIDAEALPYYVYANSSIQVLSSYITDGGNKLEPCGPVIPPGV